MAQKQSSVETRVRWNRGYAAIVGAAVDDTVRNFPVPDPSLREKIRKPESSSTTEPFHITVFTKEELRSLGQEKVKEIREDIFSLNTEFISLGIGGQNGVYFHVVVFPGGDKLRNKYGLSEKQFHITLTDKDDHNMDKSIKSLLFVNDNSTETPWNIINSLKRSDTHEILHHLYLQHPSQKLLSHFLLKAIEASTHSNYELLEFIAKEILSHPDWSATYLGAGAIFSKWKELGCGWKLAMLCYMSAWHHHMDSDRTRDTLEDYLKDRMNKCSQHSEWGWTFTEREISALQEDAPCSSFFYRFLQKPLALENFSSIVSESVNPPSLCLEPRTKVQIPLDDGSWYELPRFFRWIIPGSLCAMSTPRDKRDVEILARPPISIETIVTLTEEGPLPKEWFLGTNVENVFLPVTNYKAPTFAQIDTFVDIVTGDASKGVNGKRALIHCGGGKGRAGTFLACYIAACGFSLHRQAVPIFSANKAIEIVRNMRPGSVETSEQETFIASYVSHLWKRGDGNGLAEPEHPIEVCGLTLSKAPPFIVCCGLQGSGKSHVATMLKKHLSYEIISQDELGSKDACFAALQTALKKKNRVIIDRCNPDANQRGEWLEAASHPSDAICLYFDYPIDLCIQRCDSRTNHPTIKQGRSSAPVKGMAKLLQPPVLSEGFKSIITIRSIGASDEFLKNIGASEGNTEDVKVESKQNIIKFPRTRHLFNLGSASRDDLILTSSDANSFLRLNPEERLVLQEKVDGANLGISIDRHSLHFNVQNRSHYINSQTHQQFKSLENWLHEKREDLWKILTNDGEIAPGSLILYGEWVAARHSIHYSHLPDKFLAFDIYDIESKTFYSTVKLEKALENTSIQRPKDICIIEYQKGYKQLLKDDFIRLVSENSNYYQGPVEGIYVRKETYYQLLERAKVVRDDFISGNDHWTKGIIRWNGIANDF